MTTDPLELYQRALTGVTNVVQTAPPDRWDRPSPCAPWTAREVLGHVVDGQRQVLSLVTGRGQLTPAADLVRLAAPHPAAAWEACAGTVRDGLDGIDGRSAVPTTRGDQSVNDLLALAIIEPLVHAWDIARANGHHVELDGEAVTATLAGLRALTAPLAASGMYAAPRPTENHASEQDQLLAATGRDPHWGGQ